MSQVNIRQLFEDKQVRLELTRVAGNDGIDRIMRSEKVTFPINLGSAEKVSINELVDIVEDIAGIKLKRNYNLSAPKGVNGRNSDNTIIKSRDTGLGWEPSIPLRTGMKKTYEWIYGEMTGRKTKIHRS